MATSVSTKNGELLHDRLAVGKLTGSGNDGRKRENEKNVGAKKLPGSFEGANHSGAEAAELKIPPERQHGAEAGDENESFRRIGKTPIPQGELRKGIVGNMIDVNHQQKRAAPEIYGRNAFGFSGKVCCRCAHVFISVRQDLARLYTRCA